MEDWRFKTALICKKVTLIFDAVDVIQVPVGSVTHIVNPFHHKFKLLIYEQSFSWHNHFGSLQGVDAENFLHLNNLVLDKRLLFNSCEQNALRKLTENVEELVSLLLDSQLVSNIVLVRRGDVLRDDQVHKEANGCKKEHHLRVEWPLKVKNCLGQNRGKDACPADELSKQSLADKPRHHESHCCVSTQRKNLIILQVNWVRWAI